MRPLTLLLSAILALGTCAVGQTQALDPAAAGEASRIWSSDMQEQQTAWFRRGFDFPEGVESARLVVTCDNACVVYVNGAEVLRSSTWEEVVVVDLDDLPRHNLIAIEATNCGGPAALACWLLWTDADGSSHELVTDANWRVATAARDGWNQPDFDDRKWEAATPNFTSYFGKNLYNGSPTRIRFENRFAKAADAIEEGLPALRAARDRAAALRAIDALERAIAAARRQIWDERKAPQAERR